MQLLVQRQVPLSVLLDHVFKPEDGLLDFFLRPKGRAVSVPGYFVARRHVSPEAEQRLVDMASVNSLPQHIVPQLTNIVEEHSQMFRSSTLSQIPEK